MQDFEGKAKGELLRRFVTFFPLMSFPDYGTGT